VASASKGPASAPLGRLRRAASAILEAALAAADPFALVRANLRVTTSGLEVCGRDVPVGRGRVVLLAMGKAAGQMSSAAESILGSRLHDGLAVVPAPVSDLRRVRTRLAGHPLPDARGIAAADEAEALARSLGPHDTLLVLVSGGASALLPAPAEDLTLEDKADVTRALLRSGATIHELNTVRKHLSRLKGGGLARAAAPARVLCLALSDVVGDDLSTIASGPTVPDPTTFVEALGVLRQRRLIDVVPPRVRRRLQRGAAGRCPETAKPGDPFFRRVLTEVVGSNRFSVEAAAAAAKRAGFRPVVLTTRLEGEAREVGRALVSILRECTEANRPAAPPVCLLAGGETTVTVRGPGRGGRNQELVVAAAEALATFRAPAVVASLATDGIDGMSEAAGGVVDVLTSRRAAQIGLAPPAHFLALSDTTSFLAPLGDLIVTGPTGTNVMDVIVLLAGTVGGFALARRKPARASRGAV
jgi:glycerate 2-kinase